MTKTNIPFQEKCHTTEISGIHTSQDRCKSFGLEWYTLTSYICHNS